MCTKALIKRTNVRVKGPINSYLSVCFAGRGMTKNVSKGKKVKLLQQDRKTDSSQKRLKVDLKFYKFTKNQIWAVEWGMLAGWIYERLKTALNTLDQSLKKWRAKSKKMKKIRQS